jgi:hypothetical protein
MAEPRRRGATVPQRNGAVAAPGRGRSRDLVYALLVLAVGSLVLGLL